MHMENRPTTHTRPLAGQFCPLCGGRGTSVFGDYRSCCGNLLCWVWDTEQQYEFFYRNGYHEEGQVEKGVLTTVERDSSHYRAGVKRVRLLCELYSPYDFPTLLDVGCSAGAFVQAANEKMYEAEGIDPNIEIVAFGQKARRNVRVDDWEHVQGEWHIVSLHDVLEHLTQPLACLERMHDLLHDDGVLILEMPEVASPEFDQQRADWRHLKPKEHLCLYSMESALELARRAGFTVDTIHRPLRGSIGKIALYLRPEK